MLFPSVKDIRKLRKGLDLTQLDLASLSGVSQSTIAKIERGDMKGSYRSVVSIFEALKEERLKIKAEEKAIDVATTDLVSIQTGQKVKRASEIMRSKGFSQLPVFDGDRHIGSVSEHGILKRLQVGESMEELREKDIERVMEGVFPIVGHNTLLHVVTTLLSVNKAVLVSERGEIMGIITSSDVLKLL